jgi:O-antigen ligase
MTEFIRARPLSGAIDRVRHGEVADWLVVAIAVSLPWSTSATAILIVVWLAAVIPSLDPTSVRRELLTPAGALPVLLWGFAFIGMLWADVAWNERFQGLRGFHKLLVIPLLLAQYRHSDRAKWAILGFFLSASALVALSWLTPYPGLWGRDKADVGVPVKDYTAQSGIFAICAFGLFAQALEWWRARRTQLALGAVFVGAVFIANILFVATARTTLVIVAVLLVLFGFWQLRWKGVLAVGLLGGVLASAAWLSSPYLRGRVIDLAEDLQGHRAEGAMTSAGLRLEFWEKSADFIAAAPFVGHGTGTIAALFRRSASGEEGTTAPVTGNPHNQILAVAIQLGLVGTIVLISMWIVHLVLFCGPPTVAWYGLTIVVGNAVGSLFYSHLFDFTQGWLYVFGVGMLGGVMLGRHRADPSLRNARLTGHSARSPAT